MFFCNNLRNFVAKRKILESIKMIYTAKILYFLVVSALFAGLTACSNVSTTPQFTEEERDEVEATLNSIHTVDSLRLQINRYEAKKNVLGQMVGMRYLAKLLRDENRFKEAINCLMESLNMNAKVGDTIEMIGALNSLGTNFRRIGGLTDASTYHLQALELCLEMDDQSNERVQKNKVIALNGLGNIYLSIDNYELADTVLRKALVGEQRLGSYLGQAINLANLGVIKEHLGQIDSAWYYYRESMKMNELSHSQLGVSLCHLSFGGLYEREGNTQSALNEYKIASDLISDSQDSYHKLEAEVRIISLFIKENRIKEALEHLESAESTSLKIGSQEQQTAIYKLYYQLFKKTGDSSLALNYLERATELEKSLINIQKINEIQNGAFSLDRSRRQLQLSLVQENLQLELSKKHVIFVAFVSVILLAVAVIVFLWFHLRSRTQKHRIMQELQHSREMFFTNVTHEFRTPLTVILGMGHQLEDLEVEDMSQVRSAAKMIVRQGSSLLNLINQLLDISKVRSSVGEPKWRRGNIITFVEMVVDNFQPYAQSKRQELTYSHSLSQIKADFVPDYVNKIVSNLLSNAIKFTPQYGKINVMLEQESTSWLKINVFDTGRGVSEEVRSRMFEAFVQGNNNVSDVGTGIGLSLVKLMTEAMGGTVSVESTEGQGSTFSVILPIQHSEEVEALEKEPMESVKISLLPNMVSLAKDNGSVEETDAKAQPKSHLSVLIVEDNQDIAFYIGMHLSTYRLLYARGGAEGLQKAEEMMPDLIITDVMMPGDIDGLELCRRVRNNERICHIPIIIITAKTTENDRVHGFMAGADAYLVKPFNSEELLVRVNKLIEQRYMLREKFSHILPDEDKKGMQFSPQERQFMNRLIDSVYSLMPHGKADVENVAERMNLSRSQLNRKMMAITGQNSSTYIMRLRLVYAKRLLKSNVSMPIGDVAQRTGFEDLAYFSRIFKQQFDMTPSQYRKSV